MANRNPNYKEDAKKGGRPKGVGNKLPRDLKAKVLAICDHLEAQQKGLQEEAEKDPQWFYTNFVKPMLPKNVEITGEDGGPVDMSLTVKFVSSNGS